MSEGAVWDVCRTDSMALPPSRGRDSASDATHEFQGGQRSQAIMSTARMEEGKSLGTRLLKLSLMPRPRLFLERGRGLGMRL